MAGRLDTSVIEDKDAEPSDDYYTVIDIPNVKDIYRESGWPIYLGKDMKEKINNIEILQGVKSAEEPLSVKQACDIGKEMFCLDSKIAVSVVGLFNRGKTFLLNLITGMGLPAGKKFTTKGLSIAIPHDKTVAQSLYVIDTEGSNASLSKEAIEKALASLEKESPFVYKTPDPDADPNIEFTEAAKMKKEREREYGEFYNKAKERAIVEKLATEQLLSEIILRLAEVLIVVVNEMTWDDQQFIESLSKQLATNERLKFRLIVVHNYKETTSYDEFIEMRNKYVKSCSYGEFEKKTIVGQKDPVEVFVTKSAPEILHGFLAKDGSDLGNAMNPLTIQWIQQVCNSTQRVGPAEFVPKLISCATESLGNLVNVAGNIRLHYDPSDKKFILKSISENPKLINDIVGASRRHVTIQASTFETVYDVLEVADRYLITVDLPGYSNDKADRIGSIIPSVDPIKNILTLKGSRALYTAADNNVCYPEKDSKANIVSRHRKGGDFFCQIQLPNYVKPEVAAKWSHGTLTLSFPIIQKVTEEQNVVSV